MKNETLEPVSGGYKSSKIQDMWRRGWESTEEDGAKSALEQFYNEWVKRQRDVLCRKIRQAGHTHTPCVYALHSPSLNKVTHHSFPVVKGELDSGRLSVRGKGGRDRERREGKRRAFYDT